MKATFPYFESGLPLRSRDLNAIYARADEDVRNSRTCLHGMGIFYGLHVELKTDGSQIIIEKGAGITSQGYLFCPDKQVELTKITSTKVKVDVKRFSTDPFIDYLEQAESTSNQPTFIEVEELYVDNDETKKMGTSVRSLSSTDLFIKEGSGTDIKTINKLLVIFFQVNKTKAEGCATCDKGILADLEVKYLLVSEKAFSGLGFVCTIAQADTPTTFQPINPSLSFSRVGRGTNCLEINNWQPASYESINDAAIDNIATEIKRAVGVFGNVFSNTEGVDGLAKFESLKGVNINGQYINDYLRLVIRAYNEFVSAPFSKHFAALPPETCFPKHLVLGHFDEKPANGTAASYVFDETDTHTINTTTTRTKLYRPPYDDATEVDFAHAKRLFERLVSLLKNHNLNTELSQDLKITPSRRPSHPLSMQAIPFYLNGEEVRKTWRLEALYTDSIPYYGTPIPLINQPAFDEADFYRIEGHIGLPLLEDGQEVRNRIEFARDCQNLPFQVVLTHLTTRQEENANDLIFSQFALSNPGLEHQGGVPAGGTFVLVVDGQNVVIADFCLPYWVQPQPVDVLANMTVTYNGKNTYTFNAAKSLPSNATINWFVDDGASPVAGSEITDTRGEVFRRTFLPPTNDDVRNYFVKLEVTADGRKDIEIVTVVVQKSVVLPKPDATLQLRNESTISPKGEFSLQEDRIVCIADSFGEDGLVNVTTVFDILPTAGQDDRYRIVIIERVRELETVVEELETTITTPIVRFDKFQWNQSEVRAGKFYIIRLFSWRHDFPQIENQNDKHLTLTFRPQIVEGERGLMVDFDTPSVVEPTAAIKALRSRQKDYRTALEQVAVAQTNDKLDAKIYAALTFMSGFQHDATKLEAQLKPWQQTLTAALPSKKTAAMTAGAQAILQNMVCFLFDKLTDLQKEGLSDKVLKDLTALFAKLKSYTDLDLSALKMAWQQEAIRTTENSVTVAILESLF